MFAKKPGGRFNAFKRDNSLECYLQNPELVYNTLGKPKLTIKQQELIGLL